MAHRSNGVAPVDAGRTSIARMNEDRRLAREAQNELNIVGTRRANLLLVGSHGTIRVALDMLWPQLREPAVSWRPGQPLRLPSPGSAATLVLHDVSELTSDEQKRVLLWLNQSAGRVQVVSTSAEPIWPRVKTGAFDEVLYYRVNTIFVDVAA